MKTRIYDLLDKDTLAKLGARKPPRKRKEDWEEKKKVYMSPEETAELLWAFMARKPN